MKHILFIYLSLVLLQANSQENREVVEGFIYSFTEQPPEFIGGEDALRAYTLTSIEYPEESVLNREEGDVLVKVIVDTAGNIRNPEVLKGSYENLNNEALRIINEMPNWKPGIQDGNVVNVYYILIVKFSIKDHYIYKGNGDLVKIERNEAEYIGGKDALESFFNTRLEVPDEVDGISKIHVQLLILKNGKIKNVRILNSVHKGKIDDRILELFYQLNNWQPARANNKEVDSIVQLSVIFINHNNGEKSLQIARW